jgi:hypothetical protein
MARSLEEFKTKWMALIPPTAEDYLPQGLFYRNMPFVAHNALVKFGLSLLWSGVEFPAPDQAKV